MKFFHISDIHIGKRVCGFSMLEDQRGILAQILKLAGEHQPDGIFIAGDLYDKSMPSAEAVELADWFLSQFAQMEIPVWVIGGNHDCAERIAYGSRMMEQAGIYMSRVFDGKVQTYTVVKTVTGVLQVDGAEAVSERLQVDGAEAVTGGRNGDSNMLHVVEQADIYLLPYIRPAQVRRFFPEQSIETTQDAVAAILDGVTLRKDRVNILLLHQFMAGASVCDSEEISVGGSDQVSVDIVDGFDYVALGHLHGPQKVGRETVRYCGSPLKYSFSEVGHLKSVTVVEVSGNEKQERHMTDKTECDLPDTANRLHIAVSALPLHPRRDLRNMRGPIAQLLSPDVYRGTNTEDYLHITLTDENPVIDAIGKLREVYPNIMRLDFESGKEAELLQEDIDIEEKTPQELFAEFFVRQNGKEMSDDQRVFTEALWTSEMDRKGGEET